MPSHEVAQHAGIQFALVKLGLLNPLPGEAEAFLPRLWERLTGGAHSRVGQFFEEQKPAIAEKLQVHTQAFEAAENANAQAAQQAYFAALPDIQAANQVSNRVGELGEQRERLLQRMDKLRETLRDQYDAADLAEYTEDQLLESRPEWQRLRREASNLSTMLRDAEERYAKLNRALPAAFTPQPVDPALVAARNPLIDQWQALQRQQAETAHNLDAAIHQARTRTALGVGGVGLGAYLMRPKD